MPYKLTEWPLLLRDNPERAKALLAAELHKNKGRVIHTARSLEMSVRSVWYYIDALGMEDIVEAIRDVYRAKPKARVGMWYGEGKMGTRKLKPAKR